MKLAGLLLAVFCVAQPAFLQAGTTGTITLRGRLVIVDLDFPRNPQNPTESTAGRDTHYVLLGSGDSVWGLRFPPGTQPSGRYITGMRLEVEVLAADLLASATTPPAQRRRSLAAAGTAARGEVAGDVAPNRHSQRPRTHFTSPSPACNRRLGPGEPCKAASAQVRGTAAAAQQRHHQPQRLGGDLGLSHGRGASSLEVVRDATISSNRQRGRSLADEEPLLNGGHLTVLSWRPLTSQGSSSQGSSGQGSGGSLRTTTRAAVLQVPDPTTFWYNSGDRVIMDDVSAVIYILDMCDHGPATTKEALEAVLFGKEKVTLESYLSYCSSGLARFNRSNVLILGPVKVPCSGTYVFSDELGFETPADWETSSCRPQDYKGWLRYADQWAREAGYNINGYRHHVAIVSPNKNAWMTQTDGLNSNCDWTGLGFIGPISNDEDPMREYSDAGTPRPYREGVFGYSWIDGDHWSQIAGWAHELGHNYYLRHAAVEGCEYGDDTSVMGFCCAVRCFNAPHSWQLGWREPLHTLASNDLSIGAAQEHLLPATAVPGPAGSSLRIGIQWLDIRKPAPSYDPFSAEYTLLTPYVWVAYRKATEPFDRLEGELANGVSVYLLLQEGSYATSTTVKLATLQPGQVWRNDTFKLQVSWTGNRVDGASGADSAVVNICRFDVSQEVGFPRCLDFADNDCDGLIDWMDPDCTSPTGNPNNDPWVDDPEQPRDDIVDPVPWFITTPTSRGPARQPQPQPPPPGLPGMPATPDFPLPPYGPLRPFEELPPAAPSGTYPPTAPSPPSLPVYPVVPGPPFGPEPPGVYGPIDWSEPPDFPGAPDPPGFPNGHASPEGYAPPSYHPDSPDVPAWPSSKSPGHPVRNLISKVSAAWEPAEHAASGRRGGHASARAASGLRRSALAWSGGDEASAGGGNLPWMPYPPPPPSHFLMTMPPVPSPHRPSSGLAARELKSEAEEDSAASKANTR